MNDIRIDRMDVALDNLSPDFARAVAGGLEHAVAAELRRRLARSAGAGTSLALAAVDLGTLQVSNAQTARAVAQAIAAQLAQWLQQQLPAQNQEPL